MRKCTMDPSVQNGPLFILVLPISGSFLVVFDLKSSKGTKSSLTVTDSEENVVPCWVEALESSARRTSCLAGWKK